MDDQSTSNPGSGERPEDEAAKSPESVSGRPLIEGLATDASDAEARAFVAIGMPAASTAASNLAIRPAPVFSGTACMSSSFKRRA